MKTPNDPRHIHRRQLVKKLYSQSFITTDPSDSTEKGILSNLKKIDQLIHGAAPEWPVEKINRVDLAILRLAVYELKVALKEPPKVVIDEAIELAKEFGSQASPGFINGTLGTLIKNEN